MKKINKVLIVVLSLILLMSQMSFISFAADATIGSEDKPRVKTAVYNVSSTPTNNYHLYSTGITIVAYFELDAPLSANKTYNIKVGGDFTTLNSPASYSMAVSAEATEFNLALDNLKITGKNGNLSVIIDGQEGQTVVINEVKNSIKADDEAADLAERQRQAELESLFNTNYGSESNLIIKSSSIGMQSVKAGENFTLSLDVYATTSGYTSMKDVVCSVMTDEGTTVASGSSSYYIGEMKPGDTMTVRFPMKAINSFTGGVSKISVSVAGGSKTFSTTISVPVIQPDRFEVTDINAPEILMVGEEDVISVAFINKGKNAVSNVTATLVGENLVENKQSEYVGNVAAGTQDSIDLDVAPASAGACSGKITISYENVDGDIVDIEKEFSFTAEEGYNEWEDPGMYEEWDDVEPVQAGMPKWAWALIGVGVAGAVVATVVITKKKKAKKLLLEEGLGEDEDI